MNRKEPWWVSVFRDAVSPYVHNHGTEEGPGLGCKETMIGGRLVGDCIRKTMRPKLVRSGPEGRAEATPTAHSQMTPADAPNAADAQTESASAVSGGRP